MDNYICILGYPSIMGTSSKARTLMLDIVLNLDKNNIIHKSIIEKALQMCNRTFNKYWRELVNDGILIKAKQPKQWMVNPVYFKHHEVSDSYLAKLWEELNE